MKDLKLGIIGLSDGNGHPYSWAAIFNGYNPQFMEICPFPVIPRYLEKQKFPDDAIKGAHVTHIWTQDKKHSQHIAAASNIPNIVDNYTDMIGQVDGILLARDDYENHHIMSLPFIKAGLPIYIDKPLAVDVKTAENILNQQQYKNQIFTCSALYYAKEFQLTETEKQEIGTLSYVDACVMKDWNKYGLHIIDPILRLLPFSPIKNVCKISTSYKTTISVEWENSIVTTFSALGKTNCPISIRLFGKNGVKELIFEDTFHAFKGALQAFINSIIQKKVVIPQTHTLLSIQIIEKGNEQCHKLF